MRTKLFEIEYPKNSGKYWSWQFRLSTEPDSARKRFASQRLLAGIGKDKSSETLVLADFMDFTRTKVTSGGVEIQKGRCWLTLLVADFDVLPPGFRSFDDFREDLDRNFPKSVVLRTPSGKAKVLFLVENDIDDCHNNGSRAAATAAILSEEKYFGFDRRLSASHLVFFTRAMLKEWYSKKERLASCGRMSKLARIGDHLIKDANTTLLCKRDLLKYGWGGDPLRRFSGELPPEAAAMCARSAAMEGLIRILMASPALKIQAQLVQERLAMDLGVSIGLVNRYISRLIDDEILVRVGGYLPGRSAANYRAQGWLLRSLRTRVDVKLDPSQIRIGNGEWNEQLFKLTNFFSNREDFLFFAARLPGIRAKKERWRQAVSAWKSHERRNESRLVENKLSL